MAERARQMDDPRLLHAYELGKLIDRGDHPQRRPRIRVSRIAGLSKEQAAAAVRVATAEPEAVELVEAENDEAGRSLELDRPCFVLARPGEVTLDGGWIEKAQSRWRRLCGQDPTAGSSKQNRRDRQLKRLRKEVGNLLLRWGSELPWPPDDQWHVRGHEISPPDTFLDEGYCAPAHRWKGGEI